MILSRNWLSQYLDLTKITNPKITQALNSLGFEVEKTETPGAFNDSLIIGKILNSVKIPQTHLSLNTVQIKSQKKLSIVCGAPNVEPEQLVVVAQVGQKLADGHELQSKKIQGYESEGMLCSLAELGFNSNQLTTKESETIYVFKSVGDPDSAVGTKLNAWNFNDVLWEMDLTLNRSDALASFQLLKELANFFHQKIKWPKLHNLPIVNEEAPNVKITSKLQKIIRSCETKTWTLTQAPNGLKAQDDFLLKHLKIKSVGCFYQDLGNFNSWETGQPLILFDLEKLSAPLELNFVTWENQEVLALISGSEIVQILGLPTNSAFAPNAQTRKLGTIALSLDPIAGRAQQKKLQTMTVALQRYMKPLASNLGDISFQNYQRLLQNYQLVNGESPLKVLKSPPPTKNFFIVSLEKIQTTLGLKNLDAKTIQKLFQTLDSQVLIKGPNLEFYMDPRRTDLYGTNDILEEIARLYGYEKIPSTPLNLTSQNKMTQLAPLWEQKIQTFLSGRGLTNIKTYSLISDQEAREWDLFDLKKPLRVIDPLSQNHETYRLSLIPSFLEVAKFNASQNNNQFQLWEIADVYWAPNHHHRHLLLGISGTLWDEPLVDQKLENNYFYLKGLVETILQLYQIPQLNVDFSKTQLAPTKFHPFLQVAIKFNHQTLGYLGRLHPQFESQNKLPPTFVAELDLNLLEAISDKKVHLTPFSKFQSSRRDLSLALSKEIRYQDVLQVLTAQAPFLVAVSLNGYYQDSLMKATNEQGILLSFVFNSFHHQLSDLEINQEWTKIITKAQKIPGVRVR